MKKLIYILIALAILVAAYFIYTNFGGQGSIEAVKISDDIYMITNEDVNVAKNEPVRLSGLDNYPISTHISYDYDGGILESYPAQAGVKNVKVLSEKLKGYTAEINSAIRVVDVMQGNIELIDVREVDEFEEKHIEKAKNIPLGELEQRAANEIRKDVTVFVYCRSGNRSKTAQNILENLGYFVIDIGGIIDYNQQ